MFRTLHKAHRLFVGQHYGCEGRVVTAVRPRLITRHCAEDSTSLKLHSTSQSKGSLQVNWMKGERGGASYQSRFDNFWLRDNCRCSQCYHDNQRLFDTASQPTSIGLDRVAISACSGFLKAQWQDGHQSTYSANWLLENNYDCSEELLTIVPKLDPVKNPTSWGGEIGDHPPCVSYDNMTKDDKCFLGMSDKLEEYGFCLIKQVPHELEATKKLMHRIGVIRESFYGGICIIEPGLHVKQ